MSESTDPPRDVERQLAAFSRLFVRVSRAPEVRAILARAASDISADERQVVQAKLVATLARMAADDPEVREGFEPLAALRAPSTTYP